VPSLVVGPVQDRTPNKLRLHIDVNPTGDEGRHVLADPRATSSAC
jgi:hypothetical protein